MSVELPDPSNPLNKPGQEEQTKSLSSGLPHDAQVTDFAECSFSSSHEGLVLLSLKGRVGWVEDDRFGATLIGTHGHSFDVCLALDIIEGEFRGPGEFITYEIYVADGMERHRVLRRDLPPLSEAKKRAIHEFVEGLTFLDP
jgi:hypothetical protein